MLHSKHSDYEKQQFKAFVIRQLISVAEILSHNMQPMEHFQWPFSPTSIKNTSVANLPGSYGGLSFPESNLHMVH